VTGTQVQFFAEVRFRHERTRNLVEVRSLMSEENISSLFLRFSSLKLPQLSD